MTSCLIRAGLPGQWRRCAPRRRTWVGWIGLAAVSLVCAVNCGRAASEELIERNTYDHAIQAIPFDRLTDEAQGKLWKIVSQPSIYRRLPVTRLHSDPDMYLFLVRHPEVIVNMWDLMGVTKVSVRRTGDYTFNANDGAGTTGVAELIYGDKETHVLLGEGSYEGPILKRKIHGRCLIVLKSGYSPDAEAKTQVTHRLDMFVQIDNIGADLLAKTLYPLVGKSADHNFVETSRFVGQISQAAETRPTGMQQLAGRLTKTDPNVRNEFATLSAAIFSRTNGNMTTPVNSLAPIKDTPGEIDR
jgi:hypothetical protein